MLRSPGDHPSGYAAAEAAGAADEDVGGVFAEERRGLFDTRGLLGELVDGGEMEERDGLR